MQNFISFVKRHSIFFQSILLVAVLLLSAYLRLYKISEYMTFLGDEGRDVLIVKRMIVDHKFTLLGPTASVGGFFLGPIYYYFMLPFLWLWNLDPTGPAVMVALFGILTVYLVYRIGKDFFDYRTGIIASLLYSLSPIVIAYSRSSWNPNVVPFFATLLVYILFKYSQEQKNRYVCFAGICLGIGIQLHYLFTFLFPLVLLWVFLFRRRAFIKIFVSLVIGFIIGASPFLLFELRHGFANIRSIINFILEGKDTGFALAQYASILYDVFFRLFGRLVLRLPQRDIYDNFSKIQIHLWVILTFIAAFLSTVFLFLTVRSQVIFRKFIPMHWNKNGALLLFLWLLVPLMCFGFYRRSIYEYYFGIFFPAPFLIVSVFLSWIARFRYVWLVSFVSLVFLVYINWLGMPFWYPPNRQLEQVRRISWEAYQMTEGKPFNFALITGQNSDHAYRFFFEVWGNPPVTIENTVIDPERITVTDRLIVLCEIIDCKPLGHPLWEIAGFGRAEIVETKTVPFVTIHKLVHSMSQ
ncbi:glycosyltransferase family 39 protein [Candidatus Gottesmanbacteria bacterium]|nr:glycosyltransferase family 39 protein [Candidatus Gottesmanbacteria bacterium]